MISMIKEGQRYEDFAFLDTPVPFSEFAKDKDIDRVQLHPVVTMKNGDVFAHFGGVFRWQDNTITSLDGDSYNDKFLVHGFEWFTTTNGETGLDVIVMGDW